MFLDFPPEISEGILAYCSREDVKNLRLTCHAYCYIAPINEKLNFNNVRISLSEMVSPTFSSSTTLKSILVLTDSLSVYYAGPVAFNESKNLIGESWSTILQWCRPTRLNIRWCHIPWYSLEGICTTLCDTLVALDMYGCGIGDADMTMVCTHLKHLQRLNVGANRLTAVGLQQVHKLRSLRELEVSASPAFPEGSPLFTEYEGFCVVKGLRKLSVGVWCVGVNNEWLRNLSHLGPSELVDLDIRSAAITDRGLGVHLASIGSLERVNVSGCNKITSRGVIALIKKLPNLRELNVKHCREVLYRDMESYKSVLTIIN